MCVYMHMCVFVYACTYVHLLETSAYIYIYVWIRRGTPAKLEARYGAGVRLILANADAEKNEK